MGKLEKPNSSGHAEGTITTGSFAFDPDTMRELIKEWNELADDYQDSFDTSQEIARVEPPGLDYASKAQADAANASGRAYLRYLAHNMDYCRRQAQLYQDALNAYLGVDQSAAEDINQSGDNGGIL